LREKREEDTNGSKKLLVEFLTGYYSLEAKHDDRWINMSHSRTRFVHVVKGIAKEKRREEKRREEKRRGERERQKASVRVCVCALARAYACVLFSALDETKQGGGGGYVKIR